MNSTTVAVDLAKNVFELAVAGADWRIGERCRLNRTKFAQFFVNRPPVVRKNSVTLTGRSLIDGIPGHFDRDK
jgi:hypothetical protein